MGGIAAVFQDTVYTDYTETAPQFQLVSVFPASSEWEDVIRTDKSLDTDQDLTESSPQHLPVVNREYLPEQSDFELIDLTLTGAHPAFEILVERYRNSIYALAFRMLRNHDDAADISQDVFFKAYEALGTFRKKSSFHTWLYRIATNSCINYLRKQNIQQEIEFATYHAASQADTLESLYKIELQDVVNTAIDKLPEKQKATVILRVCEGLSHREVSKQLHCSVGTAKANYFHAIRNIRRFMKNYIVANTDVALPWSLFNEGIM
jgi:RNA polymerase sigma-70 factor (ECF subfamily)